MTDVDKRDAAPEPRKESASVRLAIDFGPLLVFVGVYAAKDIFWATGAFMVAVTAAIVASWRLRGHVPLMLWITGAVVLVFGGLTVFLQDPSFVKMKPTLVNAIFAAILFVGLARGKSFLRLVMEAAFPPLSDQGWMRLTWNWALFFAAMALVNEIVWRNYSTDFWVSFKLFGYVPMTFLFALLQTPVILRHHVEPGEDDCGDGPASAE